MKPIAMKLVPAVAALALMGAAGGANAEAYAYSYDNIFGLTVSVPTGAITLAGSTNLSRATANLNGTNISTGGIGFLDAPQAAVGAVATGQNFFSQQGMGPASFSRGDAQIVSTQFPANTSPTQAVNAAESFVTPVGSADASGRNGSTTGFSVNFSVDSPTATLGFDFSADPYMQVFLSALSGAGSSSTANLVVTFSITNAAGATVFNWAPDGMLGSGIAGGTEAADAANLNTNLATNTLTAGAVFTYDPTGCGAPVGAAIGTGCGGLFSSVTNALAAGDYTLTLNAVESTDITATAVPEPGTLALLGIGLAGLCLGSRRKQAV